GLDLKELVELGRQRTYPVPVEAALLIVAQVARALDYAHRAADNQGHALGIVHRDVTPHNILVSWAGHVKLADFGIAMAKDRGAVTEPGIVKGKLSFMAPEYLLGGAVTPLADVFALGCVLHFAIAGVSPYGTEDARRNGARGMAPPLDPTVPDDVARLVTRACHPIPEQRCASAIDLAVAAEKTLARRAGTGAMRMLTDWLQELRSRSAPAPAQRLAQLFQLEPTGYEGDSGLVRFQSIPARPAPEPAAEEIEPDPALPTSPDDTTRGGLDFLRTEVNGASMATLAPMPEPTLPSAPSVSPPSQDGKLGGYAILATLREAGRGQLLLARPREPQPGRPQVVMLKVWPAEVSRDLSFIALVTREATLRKQLTDEHLPRVLDMGVDDGRLVVELDYPLGRTLRQIVDRIRRPLAAEEVAALGVGLARGLVAGRNLREALGADFSRVPCELTPDKVFITYEGTPIVTDFAVRSAAERMLDEDWVRVTEDVARRREVWTLVNTLQGLLTDKDNRRAQTLSARISKIADSAPSHRAAKELASTLSGFVQEPARIVQGLMEELYAETARRERQVLM
ncbi:MAG: protein kinase, partial [Myxococcota bacterium]